VELNFFHGDMNKNVYLKVITKILRIFKKVFEAELAGLQWSRTLIFSGVASKVESC